MKKLLRGVLLPLVVCVVITACPDGGIEVIDYSAALVNSVWAGETPRSGDWLTITFKPNGKVIWSFTFDNTTNEWDFTFDKNNKGTITNNNPPPDNWNPAPNGFSVSGTTLTITNYGFHEGAPREFRQVRQVNGTIVNPVLFTPGALADDLVGSVWAGHTPRDGDWLTITFNTDDIVIWSFTFDNSTNEWEYSWDDVESEGTIITGIPWNPAPNGFTIEGNTLTITNYGSHEGSPREFRRYR